MSKEILRVRYNGIGGSPDMEINISSLNEILPRAGFRPLSEYTPDNLPVGAIVAIYNCNSHSLGLITILGHNFYGFKYTYNFKSLEDEDLYMSPKYDLSNKLYKVIAQLPVQNDQPQFEALPDVLAEANFQPLDKATGEDLPSSCVALLYSKSGQIFPVIVRVLSTSNNRFLYWSQSHITGAWLPGVIMDHLNHFEKYLYKVLS